MRQFAPLPKPPAERALDGLKKIAGLPVTKPRLCFACGETVRQSGCDNQNCITWKLSQIVPVLQ